MRDPQSLHPFIRTLLKHRSSSWLSARAGGLSDESVNWEETLRRANDEFAVPALWTHLLEQHHEAGPPADARSYLAFIRASNASCNEAIRVQCLRVGAVLALAGIEAVLLKGATWLFEPGPGRSDRMLRDIDLLVEEGELQRAVSALGAAGYRRSEAIHCESGHIHEVPLLCEDEPANLELHVELSARPWMLPGREVLATASARVAAGLRLPSPQSRILHNVIHAQITNGDHAGGVVSPRDALDLARLVENNIATLDWEGLAATARQRKIFDALSAALHKSGRFCGSPLPQPFAGSRRGRLHAIRCQVQRAVPPLDAALRRYGVLRRALAWERDAFPLRLGTNRGLHAHWKVNARRAQRLLRAWKRSVAKA